ncbi:DUF222 domain-containing protein [Agrococcus sp. 1P02AA]|uniref:HNH endonuclease signature motif containing protein n=1 Tax=Agrococcus sp. 1P02AA TaxID=3132259 RepID=UPI0039A676B0
MAKVREAAVAVEAARAAFAGAAELASASRQEVADLLALHAQLLRLVEAQSVRLAGEIAQRSTGPDDESICRLLGATTPRAAIAAAFGIRSRDASELLTMAAATAPATSLSGSDIPARYPRVGEALDGGTISLAQARAIVATLEPAASRADLDELAWAEGCLVDAAIDADAPLVPELLIAQGRAYVAVLDPDGVLPTDELLRAQRSLRLWRRRDGGWRMQVDSPPEDGSAIQALLDAMTSPRRAVRFVDDPVGAEDGAGDATAEPAGDGGQHAPPVDGRTLAQQRHDALIGVVHAFAASGDAPVAGGEPPRLVFVGSIEAFDAYRQGAAHRDRALRIEHTGAIVPIETVGRLLCDAVVQRTVVDSEGHVLHLGREQRTFSSKQRRALGVQYRGCGNAACGAPVSWSEAHHVRWWRDGGPTDVDNGILLCSHCHHEVHAGRLVVVGTPGHWRVVSQLRPSSRSARSSRAQVLAPVTSACAADASAPLAVRLPDAAASPDTAPLPETLAQPPSDLSPPADRSRRTAARRSADRSHRPATTRRSRSRARHGPPGQLSLVISTETNSWLFPAPAYTPRSGGTSL